MQPNCDGRILRRQPRERGLPYGKSYVFSTALIVSLTVRQRYSGLDFMKTLVDDMTRDDTAGRPPMDEVVDRFTKTRSKLHWWNLRARLARRAEWLIVRPVLGTIHVFRTARYVLKGLSATPVSSE